MYLTKFQLQFNLVPLKDYLLHNTKNAYVETKCCKGDINHQLKINHKIHL